MGFHCSQARFHTGFHRFTEIGQIFHNKHIFHNNTNRTFQVEIWKTVWKNVFFFQFRGIRQKPGKGNFREITKFKGESLKASNNIAAQSHEILQTFVLWEGFPRLCGAIQHITFKIGIFTNFKKTMEAGLLIVFIPSIKTTFGGYLCLSIRVSIVVQQESGYFVTVVVCCNMQRRKTMLQDKEH